MSEQRELTKRIADGMSERAALLHVIQILENRLDRPIELDIRSQVVIESALGTLDSIKERSK